MILLLSNLESHFNISASVQQFWARGWNTRYFSLAYRFVTYKMIASFYIASLWSVPLSPTYSPQSGSLTFSPCLFLVHRAAAPSTMPAPHSFFLCSCQLQVPGHADMLTMHGCNLILIVKYNPRTPKSPGALRNIGHVNFFNGHHWICMTNNVWSIYV